MTSLVLPPRVAAQHIDEYVDKQIRQGLEATRQVREIDPRLSIVFIGDKAPAVYGVVPGRWHVKRENDAPVPNTFIPILAEDGGYREPASDVVDTLRGQDLQNDTVAGEFFNRETRRALAREQRKQERREERADEFAGRLKAYDNPSVLVNTDVRPKRRKHV